MLRAIVLPGLLFLSTFLVAQNLVPNPSFECGNDQCDCTYDSWLIEAMGIACHWSLPTNGTSDFFSTVVANQFCWSHMLPVGEYYDPRVPYIGSQLPRTGNRFAGIFTYGKGFDNTYQKDTSEREYLQVELLEPLVPGEFYCAEMYVSLAEQPRYAANNLGMCFYGEKLRLPYFHAIPFTPQLVDKSIILNSASWTRIYGSFQADSAVQYLGIGNFYQNNETQLKDKGGTHPRAYSYNYAYYFIDDVSVTKMDVGRFASASDTIVCKGSGTRLKAEGRLENIVWTSIEDTTAVGTGASLNLVPDATTTYRVTASNCKLNVVDTITIKVLPSPQIDLVKDTTFCEGDSLTLAVQPGYASYSWQDNPGTNQFTVREAGRYTVVAKNEYDCQTRAYVNVNVRAKPKVALGNDQLICDEGFPTLRAGANQGTYSWSTGTTDSVYIPTTQGKYWVNVENQCGAASDTISIHSLQELFVPNVLTLNMEDTLNRYFIIKGVGSATYGKLVLYNRWGQQIYADGSYNNDWPADPENIPSETYYYTLAYPNCPSRKGWVKVIK